MFVAQNPDVLVGSEYLRLRVADNPKMETNETEKFGRVVVTGRTPFTSRKTRAALRKAVFPARVRGLGFKSVFVVEAQGKPPELAQQIYQTCPHLIGRATAVLDEVESKLQAIKEAAVKIGVEQIDPNESFCFRLIKRGLHNLEEDTPKIEYEIGAAINDALQVKTGKTPIVRLREPDVSVNAEVLGPITLVGILRKDWQTVASTEKLKLADDQTQTPDRQAKETASQPLRVGPSAAQAGYTKASSS